jgi:hypothetical protein
MSKYQHHLTDKKRERLRDVRQLQATTAGLVLMTSHAEEVSSTSLCSPKSA